MAISAKILEKPAEKILEFINSFQGVSSGAKSGNEILIKKLREMENAYMQKANQKMPDYESIVPKTTNTEMKKYKEKSESELLEEAKQNVMPGYTEKINNLNENAAKKIQSLEKKLGEEQTELEKNTLKAEFSFNNNASSSTNKALKQGILTSSIYANTQNSILQSYRQEIERIKNQYVFLQENIEKEINLLNQSKQNALSEYNLKMASDIEKKLTTLKNNQQSAMEAVNKYNQQLAKTEQKYQEDRLKKISELQEEWQKNYSDQLEYEHLYGYTGDNLKEMEERYNLAKDFYFNITKNDAKKLLSQNYQALSTSLGPIYYARLVEENNNR